MRPRLPPNPLPSGARPSRLSRQIHQSRIVQPAEVPFPPFPGDAEKKFFSIDLVLKEEPPVPGNVEEKEPDGRPHVACAAPRTPRRQTGRPSPTRPVSRRTRFPRPRVPGAKSKAAEAVGQLSPALSFAPPDRPSTGTTLRARPRRRRRSRHPAIRAGREDDARLVDRVLIGYSSSSLATLQRESRRGPFPFPNRRCGWPLPSRPAGRRPSAPPSSSVPASLPVPCTRSPRRSARSPDLRDGEQPGRPGTYPEAAATRSPEPRSGRGHGAPAPTRRCKRSSRRPERSAHCRIVPRRNVSLRVETALTGSGAGWDWRPARNAAAARTRAAPASSAPGTARRPGRWTAGIASPESEEEEEE